MSQLAEPYATRAPQNPANNQRWRSPYPSFISRRSPWEKSDCCPAGPKQNEDCSSASGPTRIGIRDGSCCRDVYRPCWYCAGCCWWWFCLCYCASELSCMVGGLAYIYIFWGRSKGTLKRKEVAVDLLERSWLLWTLEEAAIVCIRIVSEGWRELLTIRTIWGYIDIIVLIRNRTILYCNILIYGKEVILKLHVLISMCLGTLTFTGKKVCFNVTYYYHWDIKKPTPYH